MRMEQYTKEFLPWQVAVGFSRSAAGARAPIASIVSSVSHNVAPPSVELFRDRMYRQVRIISAANYENSLTNAIGLDMFHDETAMRLCIGSNEMQSLSISVRCLTVHLEGGGNVEMLPVLSRLEDKTALGILGGLKLNDLSLEKLAPDNGRWRFLFVTSDSASSNVLASRYFTCEAQVLRKLLIIHCPCWSHIVSLSVFHSQPNLNVADLSSLAHLIDRKKFSPIEAHDTKLVSEAKIADTQLEPEECYALWTELISFLV